MKLAGSHLLSSSAAAIAADPPHLRLAPILVIRVLNATAPHPFRSPSRFSRIPGRLYPYSRQNVRRHRVVRFIYAIWRSSFVDHPGSPFSRSSLFWICLIRPFASRSVFPVLSRIMAIPTSPRVFFLVESGPSAKLPAAAAFLPPSFLVHSFCWRSSIIRTTSDWFGFPTWGYNCLVS